MAHNPLFAFAFRVLSFLLPALLLASCAGTRQTTARLELSVEDKGVRRSVGPAIDRILGDSIFAPAMIGVEIATADSDIVLYRRNEHTLFHPASNMKLLTTAASLRFLGEWTKFVTSVRTDGMLSDSTIEGDLIIHGSGDPLLTTSSIDSLATLLALSGIRIVTGDLVGNAAIFDTVRWGNGWMWDDEPTTDAPFISPLTINANTVEVIVSPGRRTGDRPQIELVPTVSGMRIDNDGITSTDTTIAELSVDRIKGENTIVIRGRISPLQGARTFSFSVRNPEQYFLDLLAASLQSHGITVRGTTRLDTLAGASMLAFLESPLDSVLHHINKPSDNLAAENLLKTLGGKMKGLPGTSQSGLTSVKEYLALAGADTTTMILADGSGLSWYNAVSPHAVVALLREQYRRAETFSHFYESLPVAGVDGTLKNRMKRGRATGNVHAKTGSLTGVSALSGYVTCADGRMLAVSILCNHFPDDIGALREAQDSIMELLAGSRITVQK